LEVAKKAVLWRYQYLAKIWEKFAWVFFDSYSVVVEQIEVMEFKLMPEVFLAHTGAIQIRLLL